jgi:hypothetical protein
VKREMEELLLSVQTAIHLIPPTQIIHDCECMDIMNKLV